MGPLLQKGFRYFNGPIARTREGLVAARSRRCTVASDGVGDLPEARFKITICLGRRRAETPLLVGVSYFAGLLGRSEPPGAGGRKEYAEPA